MTTPTGTPTHNRPQLATAPLLDVSDRHARYFWRLLTRHALLYTEMINQSAICRGAADSHLRYNSEEHPLALQLGGSDRQQLAQSARMGAQWGYDEINLNCGCPSERVQNGAFGACLMREPQLVADCVKAMQDAAPTTPITVKHRIGLDKDHSTTLLDNFVGTLADAGIRTFIVHARNAWLKGLSPKENRDIPPLRYDIVYQLKRNFPHLHITLNGGVTDSAAIVAHLQHVDAVMIGREAWHHPWSLTQWDAIMSGTTPPPAAPLPATTPTGLTREQVEDTMVTYMEHEAAQHGTHWYTIARCMLGLRHGLRGARHWRQVWSDHRLKHLPARDVHALAHSHPHNV